MWLKKERLHERACQLYLTKAQSGDGEHVIALISDCDYVSSHIKCKEVKNLNEVIGHDEELKEMIGKDDIESIINISTKIQVTLKICEYMAGLGDKVLIFVDLRTTGGFLKKSLDHIGLNSTFIDGNVHMKLRTQMFADINRKKSSPQTPTIIIITKKVGSTGLTLTGCNGVIIYDMHWNPTVDMQAEDRVYRIGQTKPVLIIRLVHNRGIDQIKYQRQINKKYIIDCLMEHGKPMKTFTAGDLKPLLAQNEEGHITIKNQIFGFGDATAQSKIWQNAINYFKTIKNVTDVTDSFTYVYMTIVFMIKHLCIVQ